MISSASLGLMGCHALHESVQRFRETGIGRLPHEQREGCVWIQLDDTGQVSFEQHQSFLTVCPPHAGREFGHGRLAAWPSRRKPSR